MRLSDLLGKEVINLLDGSRLGVVADSDLVIDNASGQIESIILPNRGGLKGFLGDRQELVIPWEAVRRIGSEVIIVELEGAVRGLRSQFG